MSRHLVLQDLKDTEIIEIISQKYPYFSLASTNQIAQKLLDIYNTLDYSNPLEIQDSSNDSKTIILKELRTLSLRFFKNFKKFKIFFLNF